MAHDVFISHSAQDKAVADAVCHGLEKAALRCWIAPRDIAPGLPWAAAIQRAVKSSRVLVLVFSGAADRSDHVRREVSAALEAGATIVPFRLEDVQAGDELGYYLSGLHWLDATTPPIEAHVGRLAQTVKGMLGRESEGDAPSPAPPPPTTSPSSAGSRFSWPMAVMVLGLCGLGIVFALVFVAMSGNDDRRERRAQAVTPPSASGTAGASPAASDVNAMVNQATSAAMETARQATSAAMAETAADRAAQPAGAAATAGGSRPVAPARNVSLPVGPDTLDIDGGSLFGLVVVRQDGDVRVANLRTISGPMVDCSVALRQVNSAPLGPSALLGQSRDWARVLTQRLSNDGQTVTMTARPFEGGAGTVHHSQSSRAADVDRPARAGNLTVQGFNHIGGAYLHATLCMGEVETGRLGEIVGQVRVTLPVAH